MEEAVLQLHARCEEGGRAEPGWQVPPSSSASLVLPCLQSSAMLALRGVRHSFAMLLFCCSAAAAVQVAAVPAAASLPGERMVVITCTSAAVLEPASELTATTAVLG